MANMSATIPIICGSLRPRANGPGVVAWLEALSARNRDAETNKFDVKAADSLVQVPYGPVMDPTIAAMIKDSAEYADPAVQKWSAFIKSSPALVIVTPQYNWSIPGSLKNALDHIYHEWAQKPVFLITFGGHGGSQVAEHLKVILTRAFKMQLVDVLQITLPPTYISGDHRVCPDSTFMAAYDKDAQSGLHKLVQAISNSATVL